MQRRTAAATLLALAALLTAASGSRGSPRTQFRVGAVLEPAINAGFDGAVAVGVERAVRRLDVHGTVLTPSPKEGYLPSFESLARQGYDLVIGIGLYESGALDEAAVKYPSTRFVILDASNSDLAHHPRNVLGIRFAEQEAGYLVGYLAAKMEQRRGGNVISSVGGIKFVAVDRYIAGFQAGARRAVPRIVTLNGYSGDFLDPAKCRAVAAGQLARGSGVVFGVAGGCGIGALRAAGNHGAWAIGVDTDQSSVGPFVLTSAEKRLDQATFAAIKSVAAGRFAGGTTTVLGLRAGGVGLGRISKSVPQSIVRQVRQIERKIENGSIGGIPTTVK